MSQRAGKGTPEAKRLLLAQREPFPWRNSRLKRKTMPLPPEQPAGAIVTFITKVLLGTRRQ